MRQLHASIKFVTVLLAALALAGCGTDNNQTGTTTGAGETTPITIAAARAMSAGSSAIVEGYVTVAPGTFNSATSEKGFAIQDDTGGIYVTMPDAATAALGDKVRVEGKLAQSAQFTVLEATPADVTAQSGSQMVTPKEVKTGEVNEMTEGWLVHLSGKITQAVGNDAPYGYKVFVDDGSGEIQVFVHIVNNNPVIDTASLMMDQMIQVTGLSGQYETTYEVMPRQSTDLVK